MSAVENMEDNRRFLLMNRTLKRKQEPGLVALTIAGSIDGRGCRLTEESSLAGA